MDTTIQKATRIRGTLRVPGDISISHRVLILGALAKGNQTIEGLPWSDDVERTAACLRTLGCFIEEMPDGHVVIISKRWVGGQTLDAGNSVATACLLSGLAAGKGLDCTIDGDASLRKWPMGRMAEPLHTMGADVRLKDGKHLPMRIQGKKLTGITYKTPVPSALVKGAILIAGLHADGSTTVIEGIPSRDHTENLLEAMDIPIKRAGGAVTVPGGAQLKGIHVTVPGDISSAAYFIAAATCLPDSEIYLTHTGVNPTRMSAIRTMQQMGAEITLENVETQAGEPSADIIANSGRLHGIDIEGPIVPALIDELPIIALLATQAEGTTTVRDARELRHKEPDRITPIVRNLSLLGADIREREDGFAVKGPCRLKGCPVPSGGDHRIAMTMAVAGLLAEGNTKIENSEIVAASYPDFFRDVQTLAE